MGDIERGSDDHLIDNRSESQSEAVETDDMAGVRWSALMMVEVVLRRCWTRCDRVLVRLLALLALRILRVQVVALAIRMLDLLGLAA